MMTSTTFIDGFQFDGSVLDDLANDGNALEIPKGCRMRPLHVRDLEGDYMNLLKNSKYSYFEDVKDLWKKSLLQGQSVDLLHCYTIIAEDNNDKPIGTVTLTIEFKFIHKLGARGRIESFYVDPLHRNTGIDRFLIFCVLKLAVQVGTYKVSLNSPNNLLEFFGSCGLNKDSGNNVMSIDLNDKKTFSSCTDEKLGSIDLLGLNSRGDDLFDNGLLDMSSLSKIIVIPTNLCIRPLNVNDFDKGFLTLLQQLTVVGDVMKINFQERFRLMQQSSLAKYYIIIIEDVRLNTIVGCGTLFVDIHGFCRVGHVEDIVVDANLRGQNLGKLLNLCLLQLARRLKLPRITLECRDRLIPFYEQFGYKKQGNFLVCRHDK